MVKLDDTSVPKFLFSSFLIVMDLLILLICLHTHTGDVACTQ